MVEHATVERIFCVDTLHTPEVAGDFGGALSKPHEAVVKEGSGVPVGGVRIHKPCRRETEGGRGMKFQAN